MLDLGKKVVLVTGGAGGIGAAIVRAVASAGADVVLHDISARGAAAVQRSLGSERCRVVEADLAVTDAIPRLWEQAVSWRGHIDVLVNNAGIYEAAEPGGEFAAWNAAWHRTLAVNLVAPAHLCREAIRHFQKRGGGIIINIASRAAFRGDGPDFMNYAASKGGMIAMTRTIARGFARDNITAFAVAPGVVNTSFNDEMFRRYGGYDAAIKETPLGAPAEPEDIANFVLFLASGAARHATGATIDINGASYVR
ncbi:MAG TPA: SDR family oxidoreductase [Stellaceae bacterium]|nr:SDR family oxidoreductase [Stellaceae bacterium]